MTRPKWGSESMSGCSGPRAREGLEADMVGEEVRWGSKGGMGMGQWVLVLVLLATVDWGWYRIEGDRGG